MKLLLLLLLAIQIVIGFALVTVQHFNHPAGITYQNSPIPIGLRAAGPIHSIAGAYSPNHDHIVSSNVLNTAHFVQNSSPHVTYAVVPQQSSQYLPPTHFVTPTEYYPHPHHHHHHEQLSSPSRYSAKLVKPTTAPGLLPPYESSSIAQSPVSYSMYHPNTNKVYPAINYYNQLATINNSPRLNPQYSAEAIIIRPSPQDYQIIQSPNTYPISGRYALKQPSSVRPCNDTTSVETGYHHHIEKDFGKDDDDAQKPINPNAHGYDQHHYNGNVIPNKHYEPPQYDARPIEHQTPQYDDTPIKYEPPQYDVNPNKHYEPPQYDRGIYHKPPHVNTVSTSSEDGGYVNTKTYEVRRPAIQKDFYDIEHKVIVRPAGTAVIELEHGTGPVLFNPTEQPDTDHHHNQPPEADKNTNPIVPPNTKIHFHYERPIVHNDYDYYNHNNNATSDLPTNQDDDHQMTAGPEYKSPPLIPVDHQYPQHEYQTTVTPIDDQYDHDSSSHVLHTPTVPDCFSTTMSPSIDDYQHTYSVHDENTGIKGSYKTDYNSTSKDVPRNRVVVETNADQLKHEYPERGDIVRPSVLKMQQPDQFYNEMHSFEYVKTPINVQIKSNGEPSDVSHSKLITFARNSDEQTETDNQQKLLDLFSVKGSVTEIQYNNGDKSQRYEDAESGTVRARVVSVTPAPSETHASYSTTEQTNFQRVVVSKPVETVQRIEIAEPYSRVRNSPDRSKSLRKVRKPVNMPETSTSTSISQESSRSSSSEE